MRGELRCLSVCLALFLDGLLVLLPSFSSLLPQFELRPLIWVHRVSSVVDDRIFLLLVAQARHEHDNLIHYAINLETSEHRLPVSLHVSAFSTLTVVA